MNNEQLPKIIWERGKCRIVKHKELVTQYSLEILNERDSLGNPIWKRIRTTYGNIFHTLCLSYDKNRISDTYSKIFTSYADKGQIPITTLMQLIIDDVENKK